MLRKQDGEVFLHAGPTVNLAEADLASKFNQVRIELREQNLPWGQAGDLLSGKAGGIIVSLVQTDDAVYRVCDWLLFSTVLSLSAENPAVAEPVPGDSGDGCRKH